MGNQKTNTDKIKSQILPFYICLYFIIIVFNINIFNFENCYFRVPKEQNNVLWKWYKVNEIVDNTKINNTWEYKVILKFGKIMNTRSIFELVVSLVRSTVFLILLNLTWNKHLIRFVIKNMSMTCTCQLSTVCRIAFDALLDPLGVKIKLCFFLQFS